MFSVNDIVIDARASVGAPMLLTDISPVYKYENQHRTDEITGYKYSCALPAKRLDKISVKIDGAQKMEAPAEGFIEVDFVDLELFLYSMNGQIQVGARATNIVPVKTK